MKRIFIILCLITPMLLKAQYVPPSAFPGATIIDTIRVEPPNYLCHDDPWYHSVSGGRLRSSNVIIATGTSYTIAAIGGHVFNTDEPLDVVGIAGTPTLSIPWRIDYVYIDSTVAGRVPEYFQLYEATPDTFMFLDEVRWDTCTQIRKLLAEESYFDLCEAYFSKPIRVEDSFYVCFTTNNNNIIFGYYYRDLGDYTYYTVIEHPLTGMGAIKNWDNNPQPINNTLKFKLSRSIPPYNDTLWHYSHLPKLWWLLWPIFDTTGMACQSVSQLAVTPIENQSTTLTWSAPSGQIIWDVQYGHSDAPRSSYTQTRVRNTPYLNLSNLDTGAYYTVFVRAMCDIGDYSNWSDSLVFYVPGDSSNVGIRAVEQYTNLFPNPASDQATVTSSFGVKGIEVYSLKGELMEHSVRDGATVATINLQHYPAGSYIVRIRTAKGIVARHLEVVR